MIEKKMETMQILEINEMKSWIRGSVKCKPNNEGHEIYEYDGSRISRFLKGSQVSSTWSEK